MNRPEAILERNILLRLGQEADVLIAKNEVGGSFHGALAKQLCRECRAISNRYRFTAGLGTGSPDLVCLVSGTAALMELKSLTGRIRPEQRQWHEAAAKRGVRVRVIDSVEQAVEFVEEVRSGK